MPKKSTNTDKPAQRMIALNRKARFSYEILETFEAGLVLTGAEVKSVRRGEINLGESYIKSKDGELFLIGAHISPYSHSNLQTYDPIRPRKLLLKKHDILRLISKVNEKGLTMVALDVHLSPRGFLKLQMALARGKANPDKRQAIKERDQKRDLARAIKG
jgi:SsrA-binding protein